MKVEAAVVCSIGCVRDNNEDNFYFNDTWMERKKMDLGDHIKAKFSKKQLAFAVFDGMGGGDRGEYAAYLSSYQFHQWFRKIKPGADIADELPKFARSTTRRIFKHAVDGKAKMEGATAAILVIQDKTAHVGNVGDSRVFILRGGKFKQVTNDHSAAGELRKQGLISYEEARNYPNSNMIRQYLGMNPSNLPSEFISRHQIPVCANDRFILCTDGLSDLIPYRDLEAAVKSGLSPDELACKLVTDALELGGKDNTTCIVVDVKSQNLSIADDPDPLFTDEEQPSTQETTLR